MRFYGVVLTAGAIALGACAGGGDKNASTSTPDTTAAAAAASTPPAGAAAPTTTAAAATGTSAPITGKTYDIKMIGDDKGYRFEPANITLKVGDGVKFTSVSMGPHNVAFNTVPGDSANMKQLDANMPAQTGAGPGAKLAFMSGPLLVAPNDTYTVSFAGLKPGKYAFNCTPHLALGMKGEITVK